MPICNYEEEKNKDVENLFENPHISQKNKGYLKQFLTQYDVKPATISIFCKHIALFLSKTDDIKQDLNNRDKINSIFKEIRDDISITYYSFVVKSALRFVRWLNDGDKPIGFKDVKQISKNKQRRKLSPEDMITMDDVKKMIAKTPSIQMKALLMVLLDGGFRSSELIDLNYNDIKKEGNYLIVKVKDGKTGYRDVILWQSVPYLQRWLQLHPTKKANDPLWIMEYPKKSSKPIKKTLRYTYAAIRKRLKCLGVDINKPLFIYNFRHSSAYNKKMENMPPDLGSKLLGHSLKYYDEVYGRLGTKDIAERLNKHHGLAKEEETEKHNPITCIVCNFTNVPEAEFCEQCGNPLNLKTALDVEKAKNEKIDNMQKEINDLRSNFDKLSETIYVRALKEMNQKLLSSKK